MNLNINLVGLLICSFTFGFARAENYDADTKQAIETAAKAEEENAEAQEGKVEQSVASTSSATSSVMGFYGGVSLGAEALKSKFADGNAPKPDEKDSSDKNKLKKRSASKTGFLGEVFGGYNYQFEKFVVGLECSIDMRTSKNKAEVEIGMDKKASVEVKRGYTFGIAPRIGYLITDSCFGYSCIGTSLSKYRLSSKEKTDSAKTLSKRPSKAAIFIGIGVEQSFGSLFIKGECNKVFNKKVGTVGEENAKTSVKSGSWVFKIGGGYRF